MRNEEITSKTSLGSGYGCGISSSLESTRKNENQKIVNRKFNMANYKHMLALLSASSRHNIK